MLKVLLKLLIEGAKRRVEVIAVEHIATIIVTTTATVAAAILLVLVVKLLRDNDSCCCASSRENTGHQCAETHDAHAFALIGQTCAHCVGNGSFSVV